MAATHGTISSFDNSVEDWRSYTKQFGHYCEANSITMDAQKRAVLLSACGPKTYQLIRNLVSPAKPGEKGFVDIVELVSIIQRFKFNTRVRTNSYVRGFIKAVVRIL